MFSELTSSFFTTAYKMAYKTTNTFNTAATSSTTSGIQDKSVVNIFKKELHLKTVFTTERPKICSYPSSHPC